MQTFYSKSRMTSRNRDFFDLNAHQRPMVGDTKISALSIDHLGWLVCDGRLLNVSNYQFLFDVIGYSFGSNETGSQFMLPNPAGRVPGFIGSGTNLTTRAMGSNVGEETHTLTIDEMPSHTHGSVNVSGNTNGDSYTSNSGLHDHSIYDPGHYHTYFNQPNTVNPAVSATTTDVADNVNVNQNTTNSVTGIIINSNGTHNHFIGSTGGSNAHNNMQPTLFLGNLFMYCGKFSMGSYPFTQGTNLV